MRIFLFFFSIFSILIVCIPNYMYMYLIDERSESVSSVCKFEFLGPLMYIKGWKIEQCIIGIENFVQYKSGVEKVLNNQFISSTSSWNKLIVQFLFLNFIVVNFFWLILLLIDGMERTPMSRSHEGQGRIVYSYEPVVGSFVGIFCINCLLLNMNNLFT